MEGNGVLIVIGLILGGLVTVGVWGIFFALVRGQSAAKKEKTDAVRAIAVECAEADRIITSPSARAMNAHGQRAALTPRIDAIQKHLTVNMHALDVYFVKYVESRLALYQAACAQADQQAAFPLDKYLSDAASKLAEAPADRPSPSPLAAVAQDLQKRVETIPPPAFSQETVIYQKHDRKEKEPEEPPVIDLRTGVITMAEEDVEKDKPSVPVQAAKPAEKKAAPRAPAVEPAQAAIAKVEPPPAAAHASDEDVFDFEKEISRKVRHSHKDQTPDAGVLHAEKTMKWDRDELHGLPAKPDAIVVQGTEQKNAAAEGPLETFEVSGPASEGPVKHDDAMISGEDIESTLDSFFGLNK